MSFTTYYSPTEEDLKKPSKLTLEQYDKIFVNPPKLDEEDEAEFTDAMLDDAIKHNRITVNRAKKPSQSKPSVQANPNPAKNTGKVILSIEVSQQLKSKEKKEYLEKIGSRLFELWEKGEVKIVL